jgi:hypothetical protein
MCNLRPSQSLKDQTNGSRTRIPMMFMPLRFGLQWSKVVVYQGHIAHCTAVHVQFLEITLIRPQCFLQDFDVQCQQGNLNLNGDLGTADTPGGRRGL